MPVFKPASPPEALLEPSTILSLMRFRALAQACCHIPLSMPRLQPQAILGYFPKIITFLWVWIDMIIPKLTESVAIEVPP